MKLLIGTQNSGKQRDFKKAISLYAKKEFDLKLVFPQDLGIINDIPESGDTFEENSLLKAQYYYEKSGIPVVSDDGGIMIRSLNNEPGIKSRRWLGKISTDQKLIDHTLRMLEQYPMKSERSAVFETWVTYIDNNNIIKAHGRTEGYIAKRPFKQKPTIGLPYRALFKIENGKYYDELTEKEHRIFNHRYKAIRFLFSRLMEFRLT